MLPIYLILTFSNNILSFCLTKKRSNLFMNDTFMGVILTSLISGVIAMLFFSILSKFNYSGINLRTIVYTILYTIQCFISYYFSLIIYRYLTIIDNSIISGFLGLVFNTLYSLLIFGEELNLRSIISILLRVAATFISFANIKRVVQVSEDEKKEKRKTFKKGVIISLLMSLFASFSGMLSKSYANDKNLGLVADHNVYFFLVNCFILAVSLIIFVFFMLFKRKFMICHLKAVNKAALPVLVISTVSSNLASTLNQYVLQYLPILVATPITGSLGSLATIISAKIFKEKVTIFKVFALILTILAATVMILPI